MDYTTSPDYVVHSSGRRMHSDAGPIDTVLSANDANMLIWSLMQLLSDAGVSSAAFDPNNTSTFSRVSQAVLARATAAVNAAMVGANSGYGFQRMPGSGFIIQGGSYSGDIYSSGSGPTITFPIAFTTTLYGLGGFGRNLGADGGADAWINLRARGLTSFTVQADWAGTGGTDVAHGFEWIAIGY